MLALALALVLNAIAFALVPASTAETRVLADPPVATAPAAGTQAPLPRRAGPLGIRIDPQVEGKIAVSEVVAGLPADRAGVKAGDVILSIARQPVPVREVLAKTMRLLHGGQTVPLEVQRGDAKLTLEVTLAGESEAIEGSAVRYETVQHPDGYRLRTIISEPLQSPLRKDGKLPAFLYVQGIICDTIDRPNYPEASDTRIVHAAAKAGFITMRVDKPGVGDSEGPDCSEIDFSTELKGYKAALRQLASLPNVDPSRIYVFGHSMGGVMAPYLSADTPVRGTIVYGTLVGTWFEYQLENARRQAELRGMSPSEVSARVLEEARSSSMILVDKKTLGDVWERWPEMREPTQGVMYDETHMSTRHMRFFHELQDLNLAAAWEKSTGSVLAIWGEFDWVTSKREHDRIAEIVNAQREGAASVLVMPKADHGFTTHADIRSSVAMMGGGKFDETLPVKVLEWIASVESRAAPSAPSTQAAAKPALPEWTKLATEPYPGKQDDIVFVNTDLGFYGNGAGKIFRTTDGGNTWQKVFEQKGTFVRCLAFTDEKHGVMGNIGPGYFPGVTDATPIYRTEDGGTTWTPVTAIEGAPVVGLCAFDVVEVPFINAGKLDQRPRIVGVGRVGGPTAYIWSDDLGKTWKQGKIPEVGTMAFDVKFLDDRHGFIASATHADVSQSHALILATEDGGASWREVYRSTRPFELTWKLCFPSKDVGYCTVQSYDPDTTASKRYVAKTTDGGKTWSELPLVDNHAVREFGIAFVDENTGWVGAAPHGFGTTDGGKTWSPVSFGNAVNKIRIVRTPQEAILYAIGVEVHRMRIPASPSAAN